MYRLLASILFSALLTQGCTVADVAYHPVCKGAAQCSASELQSAVAIRTDVKIRNDGWGACLDASSPIKLEDTPLAINNRCKPADAGSLLPAEYSQAWLEYNDNGQRLDGSQKLAILNWIEQNSGPIYIVVYVHGWHNNADDKNGDPRNNAIKFAFLMARQVDTLKRMALDGKSPMPKVLGIYVGWRGEAYTDPLRQFLSIHGRSKAADRIGSAGPLRDDLKEIAQAMRDKNANASRMVVFGHSLGGRLLTSAFIADPETSPDRLPVVTPQPLGANTLVVTLNAAVSADCYNRVFGEGGTNPNTPRPTWINITSENDTATDGVYSLATFVGLVKSCTRDTQLRAEGVRREHEKAIGHSRPYFRQVIDQASGLYSDPSGRIAAGYIGDKALSWEPAWYKESGTRLFMKFPLRTETSEIAGKADYASVNVGVENDELPTRVLDRAFWNVRSDQSLFDFGFEGGSVGGRHNGIISTILVRMITEILYPPE